MSQDTDTDLLVMKKYKYYKPVDTIKLKKSHENNFKT